MWQGMPWFATCLLARPFSHIFVANVCLTQKSIMHHNISVQFWHSPAMWLAPGLFPIMPLGNTLSVFPVTPGLYWASAWHLVTSMILLTSLWVSTLADTLFSHHWSYCRVINYSWFACVFLHPRKAMLMSNINRLHFLLQFGNLWVWLACLLHL